MNRTLTQLYKFQATDLADQGEFVGYASTFDSTPDSYGDLIAPGAYTKSLGEHAAKGTMPALLWSHQLAEPIGKWMELKETARGLQGRGKLTLATARGAEAYALMKDGAVGLSVGYTIPPDGIACDGEVCLLTAIDLLEVSVVSIPANSNARILAVKSACECGSLREFEALVRDALGLSKNQAKRLANAGWPALRDRDDRPPADSADLEPILAELRSLTQFMKGKL